MSKTKGGGGVGKNRKNVNQLIFGVCQNKETLLGLRQDPCGREEKSQREMSHFHGMVSSSHQENHHPPTWFLARLGLFDTHRHQKKVSSPDQMTHTHSLGRGLENFIYKYIFIKRSHPPYTIRSLSYF